MSFDNALIWAWCECNTKADQRFIEYRSKFAAHADREVKSFFECEENSDELFRRAFTSRALGSQTAPDFVWMNFDTGEFNNVIIIPLLNDSMTFLL